MQHIGRNRATFFVRIVSPFLVIWLFKDAFQYMLNIPVEKSTIPMILLIAVLHVYWGLFLIIGLLFKTSRVSFGNDELIVSTLIGTRRVIYNKDIIGFSTTTYMALNFIGFNGLQLYLNNGKVIELTEYNIRTIKPLYKTLHESKIKYLGHEISWFPFRPIKYKFQQNS